MQIDVSKMTLPEIFNHLSELTNEDRPIAIKAISNFRPDLKIVFQLIHDKNIEFDLPSGVPPYKPLDMPNNWGYNRLPKELRKFNYFIKSVTPNLNKIKREKIFIELLESVSAEEAKLVLMIKERKLEYKGLTKRYVKKAFPEFFPGDTEE